MCTLSFFFLPLPLVNLFMVWGIHMHTVLICCAQVTSQNSYCISIKLCKDEDGERRVGKCKRQDRHGWHWHTHDWKNFSHEWFRDFELVTFSCHLCRKWKWCFASFASLHVPSCALTDNSSAALGEEMLNLHSPVPQPVTGTTADIRNWIGMATGSNETKSLLNQI